MSNRFGLKDVIILVLLLVMMLMGFLSMQQSDREWNLQQDIQQDFEELKTALARNSRETTDSVKSLTDRLDRLITSGISVTDAPSSGAPQPVNLDWVRPDGPPPVVQTPWSHTNPPKADPAAAEGGTFVEIFEAQLTKITPYLFSDVYGRRVNDLVVESLGWYDPNELTLRGRLAEAWQYAEDGMWLRVKIRDQARFSDGMPVTAEDVRFTFHDVIFNPQIEADRDRTVYYNIDEVVPISEKVVEFRFKKTHFENLEQACLFKILPKHIYEEHIESPTIFNAMSGFLVGSGPFKLADLDMDDQWRPGRDIRLVRNESYWGPLPLVDSIRFTVTSDGQARLVEYANGSGDMMRPSSQQIVSMREDDEFQAKHDERVWYNMRGGYAFFAWQNGDRPNGDPSPFADKRVRNAMTHIIDRDRLIRDISFGLARPSTGPFSSASPQSNPNIEPLPYDLDKARQLLAEAGWEDSNGDNILDKLYDDGERRDFIFKFTYSNGQESTERIAKYLKDQCALVGIKCDLDPIDWSILTERLNTREFDAITLAWSASKPEADPRQLWHSDSADGQGDNFAQWRSPAADELIERGSTIVDFEERMQVWHQLHQHIHEEQPYTFLYELPWRRFTTKRVNNLTEYKSGFDHTELWLDTAGGAGSVTSP